MIHIPAGVRMLLQHPRVQLELTAPSPRPSTGGRRIHWPRGKVLGGSSSINGMHYVRGNPADYDGWAQRGCRGWSYDERAALLQEVGRLPRAAATTGIAGGAACWRSRTTVRSCR